MNIKRRPLLLIFLVPIVVLGLVIALWNSRIAQQLENVTVDWRFEARAGRDLPADDRIVVVGIDEQSLENLARWPWPRHVHGVFLQSLLKKPPAAVAFDLLFTEASEDASQDEKFVMPMELYPNAISGAAFESDASAFEGKKIGKTEPFSDIKGDQSKILGGDTGITPIEPVAQASWTGFVNVPASVVDGVRWEAPLLTRLGTQVYPSLALQILMRLENSRAEDVRISLGESIQILSEDGSVLRDIPIDERGFIRLNYRNLDGFQNIGYYSLLWQLNEFPETPWPAGFPKLDGQAIIVGQTAEGLTDFGETPLYSRTPLVYVQATAVNNLLQEDFLTLAPRWPILVGWLILMWVTLVLLRHATVTLGVVVPLVIAVLYIVLAFWQFETSSLQFPVFMPVASFIGLHIGAVTDRLYREIQAKSRIKGMFGTYVSPEVVDAMVASDDPPKLGGEICEITAFFSDIQGFSSFSELLEAEQLVQLLNEYLGPFTDILTYSGGTLDKYIGDAIVAMFGAPLPFEDHAHRGCVTAIKMQQKQAELRMKWKADGNWPDIVHQMQTRIGLNTGKAVIGNMGSPRRFNYTMMGDDVNLAARMESGAKSYGAYNMITETTHDQSVASSDDIAFRFLDRIVVKGRTKPTKTYEIIGFKSELSQKTADCLGTFAEGMTKYLNQDWDGATQLFKESAPLELFQPEDRSLEIATNPSLVMTARCTEMKAVPPGDDWDGVYKMTSK